MKPEKPPKQIKRPDFRLSGARLAWGGFFLSIGLIALLDVLGLIEVSLSQLFRLWPLLVIAFGLSLLSFEGRLSRLVVAVFIAVFIAASFLVLTGSTDTIHTVTSEVEIEVAEATEKLRVEYRGAAGETEISSSPNRDMVRASARGGMSSIEYSQRQDGSLQVISLRNHLQRMSTMMRLRGSNQVALELPEGISSDLVVRADAVKLTGDILRLSLDSLMLDINAGEVSLDLPHPDNETTIALVGNAAKFTFTVPDSVGVEVDVSTRVSSTELGGLSREDDGVYRTANYNEASERISITGTLNASSLRVILANQR